jgi:hypothetical protein
VVVAPLHLGSHGVAVAPADVRHVITSISPAAPGYLNNLVTLE